MEPNDGTSEPKSRKSTLRPWKKYSGNKEWTNGCGSPVPDDSGEFGHGPPILTIEVDESKEIDLTHRVRQKSEKEMDKEFALAAREAVLSQMEELGDECSDEECATSSEFDSSARSLPPPNMNPTSLLEAFGTAKVRNDEV